jgi:citrate/tricarballylate utilization protein
MSLPQLELLTAQASQWDTQGQIAAETEAARQLQICNACRYCEGFCAMFPAMTRRLEFASADVHYLANLCHNCGACLHACQYAPPHEFGVNVPQAMASVRKHTYRAFAWPAAFGNLYKRQGLPLTLVLSLIFALVIWLLAQRQSAASGLFYDLLGHNALVALFAPVFLLAALALGVGIARFWRQAVPVTSGAALGTDAGIEATRNVLTLTYLDGGHGDGCNNADDAFTHARRHAHHATFYGFLLCFAATSVATLYHYIGQSPAPYDLPSLPKLLGATGGVLMLIGCTGLFWLSLLRHPQHGEAQQQPMDRGFIALLWLIAATGLALWAARSTAATPALLALHLGTVLTLFATAPYSKFAHGFYRTAALLRHNVEKRQPNKLGLGAD